MVYRKEKKKKRKKEKKSALRNKDILFSSNVTKKLSRKQWMILSGEMKVNVKV